MEDGIIGNASTIIEKNEGTEGADRNTSVDFPCHRNTDIVTETEFSDTWRRWLDMPINVATSVGFLYRDI
jgi:hypothetical protein